MRSLRVPGSISEGQRTKKENVSRHRAPRFLASGIDYVALRIGAIVDQNDDGIFRDSPAVEMAELSDILVDVFNHGENAGNRVRHFRCREE